MWIGVGLKMFAKITLGWGCLLFMGYARIEMMLTTVLTVGVVVVHA